MNIQLYIDRLEATIQDANNSLGTLSPAQLNWKPNPKSWSIAQCLDHILITNREYAFNFEAFAQGNKQNSFWENLGFLSGFMAKMLRKTVDPQNVKKTKTPSLFSPSQSDLPADMLAIFEKGIRQQITYFEAIRELDHEKERVTTPISAVVTFRLADAIEIITMHTERHIQQAKNILPLLEAEKVS